MYCVGKTEQYYVTRFKKKTTVGPTALNNYSEHLQCSVKDI